MALQLKTSPTASQPDVSPQPGDARRTCLRFVACGSVDDGKSTVIGRLLYEAGVLHDDVIEGLQRDSRAPGAGAEAAMDFSLLLDGLQAEREQGITIDVAYRYFSTSQRSFIVVDAPGHEQYTRNMATAASNCDVAVILVDASKGLLAQTRRHTYIAHLLGIRHVVLAVNKMDLVDYDRVKFEEIVRAYRVFVAALGLRQLQAIPLSARHGDNLVEPSKQMPWYAGPTLLQSLETMEAADVAGPQPFRMAVQWVCRPDSDFRGYAGRIASGTVTVGDEVAVLPSGQVSKIARIVTYSDDLYRASAGDSVVLTLEHEIDVSRGDVIAHSSDRPQIADQLTAHVVWFADTPMLPGRSYLLKCGTETCLAQVMALRHKVDISNFSELAAGELAINEIGYCDISLSKPIAVEPYAVSRQGGAFILVDRVSNATVAAGMVRSTLRRAQDVHWQTLEITKHHRGALMAQRPCCLWLTGLSGSGKSTIAGLLEKRLYGLGHHTYVLDGDNIRHGLNRDLGFSAHDRVENIRRVGEVAKLMVDAGLMTIVAFISPFRAERDLARELFAGDEFLEIFVDAPIELCESRDPKGLYRRARQGQISNFTGVSSPYEAPEKPDLRLDTAKGTPTDLVEDVVAHLRTQGLLMPKVARSAG